MSSNEWLCDDLTPLRSWVLEMLEHVSMTVQEFLRKLKLREKVATVCEEFLAVCGYIKRHVSQYTKIWIRARRLGGNLSQMVNYQLSRWGPHVEYPVRYLRHCVLYRVWPGDSVLTWIYFLAVYMWIRTAVS